MAMNFTPVTGIRDVAAYPPKPTAGASRNYFMVPAEQLRDEMNKYLNMYTDTGAADAYVVTLAPVPTSYPLVILMKAANANTGASTINPNSLGVKAIKKVVSTALVANDILVGGEYLLVYDGTNYQLVNPALDATLAKFKSGNSTYTDNDTAQTFSDTFCTASSLVVVAVTGSTPAGVWSVTSAPGTFTITSTAAESTDITFDYFITKVV